VNKLNEFEIIRIATFLIFIAYCIFKFFLKVFFSTFEVWFIYFLFATIIAFTNHKISARKFWIPVYVIGGILLILAFVSQGVYS